MRRELRWKVYRGVTGANLQDRLNKASRDGWSVQNVFSNSFSVYTVITNRTVKVKAAAKARG
jgi:hypothetical protein